MDWELAIRRNREDLLKIVAMIFITIGLMPGTVVATLPRRVYYAAQRILRPAESAVRRLIFMRAQGMTAPEVKSPPGSKSKDTPRNNAPEHVPAFCLIDPRKNFDDHRTQLRSIYDPPPVPVPPLPEDDPIDSKQLFRRLGALQRALNDLPGRAMRSMRKTRRRERVTLRG